MNAVVQLQPQSGSLIHNTGGGRMAVADVVSHALAVQEVMKSVMKKDVHYGKIPGTPKPTLYKPGAEMLCMVFHIAPSYRIEDLSTPDSIRYRVTCVGTHQTSGVVMGEALGEASSSEEKYKWRKSICEDEFEETPQNMRRVKFGKGQGGDVYRQKQVRTEPADLANTVLKMANKRAQIAMVLNVLAASDMFSQDLEDLSAELRDQLARQEQAGEPQPEQQPTGPQPWPDDKLEQRFPKAREWLAAGKTHEDIIQFLAGKGTLSDAQKVKVRELKPAAPAAADVTDVAPKITYAAVADKIVKAMSLDVLTDAEALIGELAGAQQRTDALALAKDRRANLEERAR